MTIELFLLSLASLAFIALLVGSGALWIQLLLRVSNGQALLPARFRKQTAHVPLFAFALVCAYLGVGLWQKAQPREDKPEIADIQTILNATIAEGLMIIVALGILLASLSKRRTDLYRLGFRFDQLSRQLYDGVQGFLAALIPVFSVLLLTMPLRSLETTHPFLQLLNAEGSAVFIAVFVAAVVVAPVMEELVFRVILQSTLVRWCGAKIGISITAILFAAVHGFPDSIGLLPLAFLLGYIYHQRRSFLSVVVLHALFNGFNIGLLLLQKVAESVSQTSDVLP